MHMASVTPILNNTIQNRLSEKPFLANSFAGTKSNLHIIFDAITKVISLILHGLRDKTVSKQASRKSRLKGSTYEDPGSIPGQKNPQGEFHGNLMI